MLLALLATAHAARLSGEVRGPDGAPAEGVAVVAYDARLDPFAALTDGEGRYALDGLPAGRYRLRAVPAAEVDLVAAFWPASWSFCDARTIALAEDEAREGLDFALVAGGVIEGVVTDLDGAPIPGVRVSCEGDEPRVANELRRTTTDERGAFTCPGLDADLDADAEYLLRFEVRGWPDQLLGPAYDEDDADRVALRRGERVDLGALPLRDGISVSGQVRGPEGPLAGAEVHVYSPSQVVSLVADEDGRYLAEGLPPGEVVAWSKADGHALTYWPDADRPGDRFSAPEEGLLVEDLDLTLPAEARFNGRFEGEAADLSGVTALLWNDSYTVGQGGPAEADGRFSLGHLHGGAYHLFLYAEREGHLDAFVLDEGGARRSFEVAPGEDAPEVVVTLPLGAALAGRVLDEQGRPVYGATVSVTPTAEGGPSGATSTDRDGAWRVEGLEAGEVLLSARYTPYCAGDGGYTEAWWPEARAEADAGALVLAEGQIEEGLRLVMEVDADGDGLGDAWEEANGLDPTRDDSGEDPDGDGLSNLDEYLQGSDPMGAEAGCGGCAGGPPGAGAALALLGLLGRRRRA